MNLKAVRIQSGKGKSQLEVAKELNLPQSTLSNYENNKTEPDIETLKRFADYYDVSIDFLIGRARPYDLPSATTIKQKELIKLILQCEDNTCDKIEAYTYGLLAGQRDQAQSKSKFEEE